MTEKWQDLGWGGKSSKLFTQYNIKLSAATRLDHKSLVDDKVRDEK